MKQFFQEFKTFAMRGNVLDMAIGVVVGAAFKAIVDSLVNDIISPLIGLIFASDFSAVVLTVRGGGHRDRVLSQRGHQLSDRGLLPLCGHQDGQRRGFPL